MRLTEICDSADTGPIIAPVYGTEVSPFIVPMRSARPCSEDSVADPADQAGPGTDDAVAQVTILSEALRRARRSGTIPGELTEAEQSLARRIRAHLARGQITVTLTDNRYTMISVRRQPRGHGQRSYDVRLHCMFADADPVITRALARYVAENDRDASRILGDFIDANQEVVRGRTRKSPTQVMLTAGDHHDLRLIFDDLNARFFGGQIDAAITWGQRTGRPKRRHSIKMGSYSVEERLIRIHRSLDRSFVPRFFVEWIVFHEMLHQVHDIKVKNGRREFHSKAFMADEARFDRYDDARTWERVHLDALLTY